MSNVKVTDILGPFEAAAAPFWDERRKSLFFVDVYKCVAHKVEMETNAHTSVKVGDKPLHFIIPVEDFKNKFLVGYGSELAAITWDEVNDACRLEIIQCVDPYPGNIISCAAVSPGGILFMGTRSTNDVKKKAKMYSFRGCAVQCIMKEASICNGFAWDQEEKHFYFVDTPEYRVERYPYNSETGEIKFEGCVLYHFDDDDLSGCPAGLTCDAEGKLWVGDYDGGKILRIDASTGRLMTAIVVPAKQVTALCFGGVHMDILFVTTANVKIPESEATATSAGYLFAVQGLGVKGFPGVTLRLEK